MAEPEKSGVERARGESFSGAAFEPFAGDRASIEGPRPLAPSSTNAAQAHSPAVPPAQGFPDRRPRPNPR